MAASASRFSRVYTAPTGLFGELMMTAAVFSLMAAPMASTSSWKLGTCVGFFFIDKAMFEIYTGVGIATGKKSVAFNLTLRADDRSLTAEEADADVKSILTALEQECGAVLR